MFTRDVEKCSKEERSVVGSEAIVRRDSPAVRCADQMKDVLSHEVTHTFLDLDENPLESVLCGDLLQCCRDARRQRWKLSDFNVTAPVAVTTDAELGGEEADVDSDGGQGDGMR